MSGHKLEIKNLHVGIEGKEILKGVNLTVNQGEIHALMGPNGSGKSTLAYAIAGHPKYEVTEGEVLLDGENILELEANERAIKGLFLAFQYPTAIPGVSVANFLRSAVSAIRFGNGNGNGKAEKTEGSMPESNMIPMRDFRKELNESMKLMGVDKGFAKRYLNDGFSGGEKKRMEILQMSMLKPKFSILDETDSGLDIDALRTVSEGVNRLAGPDLGVLIITHYQRILNYIKPQFVHIFMAGRVVESGGPDLALQLEEKGYEFIREKYGLQIDLGEEDKVALKLVKQD
jgi:Fe-S cluster assembly ATP-binding protein